MFIHAFIHTYTDSCILNCLDFITNDVLEFYIVYAIFFFFLYTHTINTHTHTRTQYYCVSTLEWFIFFYFMTLYTDRNSFESPDKYQNIAYKKLIRIALSWHSSYHGNESIG